MVYFQNCSQPTSFLPSQRAPVTSWGRSPPTPSSPETSETSGPASSTYTSLVIKNGRLAPLKWCVYCVQHYSSVTYQSRSILWGLCVRSHVICYLRENYFKNWKCTLMAKISFHSRNLKSQCMFTSESFPPLNYNAVETPHEGVLDVLLALPHPFLLVLSVLFGAKWLVMARLVANCINNVFWNELLSRVVRFRQFDNQ